MNSVTTATVSLGGVTIGLGILAWHLTKFWRGGGKGGPGGPGGPGGGRDPKVLIPLLSSMALGMVSVTAAGGLIGTAATFLLNTGSLVGNWSLVSLTGTATPEVTRSGLKSLTPGGCALLVIYCVVVVALWKSGAKLLKGKIVSGLIAGVMLGLSAGFSGMASVALVTMTNTIGDKITGVVL
ncbi:hypothetical protein OG258_19875 [Streptomyces mirabilis]|uniref:hypothetical protein n=1 Tax=Streptomyces mirabilis TaxID=68239 RepID=UPI002E2B6538|nr:hypothetical protein [Streptomyces mirabilis]